MTMYTESSEALGHFLLSRARSDAWFEATRYGANYSFLFGAGHGGYINFNSTGYQSYMHNFLESGARNPYIFAGGVWDSLKGAAGRAWDWVKGTASKAAGAVKNAWNDQWSAVGNAARWWWGTQKSGFNWAKGVWNSVSNVYARAAGWVQDRIDTAGEFYFGEGWYGFKRGVKTVWDNPFFQIALAFVPIEDFFAIAKLGLLGAKYLKELNLLEHGIDFKYAFAGLLETGSMKKAWNWIKDLWRKPLSWNEFSKSLHSLKGSYRGDVMIDEAGNVFRKSDGEPLGNIEEYIHRRKKDEY